MRLSTLRALAAGLTLAAAAPLQAQVSWTDWTSNSTNQVNGTLTIGLNNIGVTFSGQYSFADLGGNFNYWQWTPGIYPPNAPTNSDMIQLTNGGRKTITFSQAVIDPVIGLVSWNSQPTITFNGPLTVLGQGCGYWGCGTMSVSGNDLITSGEVHGTIKLIGSYTAISFTDGTEGWHGLTVGSAAVASTVPEPSTYALMGVGLAAMALVRRRRRA